ncbi:MAG: PKD domain-containing protein, partial [Actinomycetota bacterium]|nr:PKD domain-containing protein [Actinomycetota bacterium]
EEGTPRPRTGGRSTGSGYNSAFIVLRASAVGVSPTTLQMRAWLSGQAEPTTWHLTRTDSQLDLQASGAVGLWTYLPKSTTNAPVRFSFDEFRVTTSD